MQRALAPQPRACDLQVVLPRVHAKFAQLLASVFKMRGGQLHASLLAELRSPVKPELTVEAGVALLRKLLTEEHALLAQCAESHECCLEMLQLAPPAEAHLCAMLDACAARAAHLPPATGGGQAPSTRGEEAAGLRAAVRLLCAASAGAAEHWRDRHTAVAEALSQGGAHT